MYTHTLSLYSLSLSLSLSLSQVSAYIESTPLVQTAEEGGGEEVT
jgi:hypothetical protein